MPKYELSLAAAPTITIILPSAPSVGDIISISSGIDGKDGAYVITNVKPGESVTMRKCPECGIMYPGLHPMTECKHGVVERVHES
jgi:hypothetical protein